MSQSTIDFPSTIEYPDHETSNPPDYASTNRLLRWLIAYTALAVGMVTFILVSLIPVERHAALAAKIDQESFSGYRTASTEQAR